MNNINNIEQFWWEVNIFNKKDWLLEGVKLTINERAFMCLAHFINNMKLWDNLKILEVWPLPIFEKDYENNCAPISSFKDALPNNNYLWVWWHMNNEVQTKQFMWDVPFISWMIDSRYPERWIDRILEHFKWAPNIVYWKHVFENSSSWEGTFPSWRPFMLDWTAQVLEDWWYLIIDNSFGDYSCVLKWSKTYSKHLKLVSVYYYKENQGIYIYKKPVNTNELASQEIELSKNKILLYELLDIKKKAEAILQNSNSHTNSIKREQMKIKTKIKKINDQLEKLRETEKDIPNKQKIIANLEESLVKLNFNLELLQPQLIIQPNIIAKNETELIEIDSQILEVRRKIEELI